MSFHPFPINYRNGSVSIDLTMPNFAIVVQAIQRFLNLTSALSLTDPMEDTENIGWEP